MTRVCVLGAGAWGLTLADLLAEKANTVVVWDRNPEAIEQLRRERTRGKPRDLRVRDGVAFDTDFEAALSSAEYIISAVASHALREVCTRIKAAGLGDKVFVSCSKGIEQNTLMLPSQIFVDVLGGKYSDNFAVLAGPSHAEEVCRRIPTVVVSCSASMPTAEAVRDLFLLPSFRVYTQTDCIGVELGGAVKNVIAVAAGVSDGLGYGDNTKAAIVTRGLAEIVRLGAAAGAQAQTIMGISGVGDLIVTALSGHSRNRAFGELLARGRDVAQAQQEIGAVVEGYRTSRSAHDLAGKLGVEMPITSAVYGICHKDVPIHDAIDTLLQRIPRPEVY